MYMNSYKDYMNSYVYEFTYEFIYEFGCTKVPDAPGRGAGRPQCRPRASCDGCAYLRTVAHSLLLTVSAKG